MSKFICKAILFRSSHLGTLRNRNPSVCSLSLRWFSSGSSDEEQSFTVSYLIDSIGLSPEQALSASKLVSFGSYGRPDRVIRVLAQYGCSKTEIATAVRKCPRILVCDSEKTVLPKLEFLKAKGISNLEMGKVLSSCPKIFQFSLDNTVIPSYGFVRSLFQSEEECIAAVKRYPHFLVFNFIRMGPNIDTLREHGVPDSNIIKLMRMQTRFPVLHPDHYRKVVEKVAEMGFNALKYNFVVAVYVLLVVTQSTWQSKVDVYKKWGLSDEEILRGFRLNPWFMCTSEGKISACMNFFVNEMGWRPSVIIKRPTVLGLSLKKRIIPRCLVFQVLVSKGLMEDKVNLRSLTSTEDQFLKNWIAPHEKEAPEILKLYKEKRSH